MDGVLTDFIGGYAKLTGLRVSAWGPKFIDKYCDSVPSQVFWHPVNKAGYEWWANLDWCEGGKDLWEVIRKFSPSILTAPSKGIGCPTGKYLWVHKNLLRYNARKDEFIVPEVIIEKDKFLYASSNSILIDDLPENIIKWEDNGGVGILHTSVEDTVQKLKKLGVL